MNRDVRTVQRWEKKGLPVHRQDQVGAVFALKSEIDAWWNSAQKGIEAEKASSEQEKDSAYPGDDLPTEVKVYVPDHDTTGGFVRRRRIVITVTFLIAVFGIGSVLWHPTLQSSLPVPARVVVLPFDNLSGDSKQEYFARGISDDVTSEFGRLPSPGISVVARATAEHYKSKPIDQIGRELHVQYVVEGSVRRENERVRINVQLVQVEDQIQLWARSYDELSSDALSFPSEIAALLESEIRAHSTVSSRGSFLSRFRPAKAPQQKVGTSNLKAYDDFLRGRYFWSKRGVESMGKAIQYFQAAIADDPNFPAAYAGLANGLVLLGSAQSGVLRPDDAFPKARLAAEKALSLDDSLPEAHASLAYISLVYDHDFSKSRREFERAIQLNPSYPTAHQWLGLYFDATGDTVAAIDSVRRAREQDSLSLAVNIALAESYYFARDYQHASELANAAIELDPNSALAHFNLGRVLVMQADYPRALSEFQLARATSPNAATLVPLAYTYGISGNTLMAAEYLKQIEKLSKSQYVPAIYFAMIYVGLKDKDNAFAYLNRALTEHCDYLVFLSQDPMADPLRDDPRFAALTQQIKNGSRLN